MFSSIVGNMCSVNWLVNELERICLALEIKELSKMIEFLHDDKEFSKYLQHKGAEDPITAFSTSPQVTK